MVGYDAIAAAGTALKKASWHILLGSGYAMRVRKDVRLYAGGEDNFCQRLNRDPDGSFRGFGVLDRYPLKNLSVEPVTSEIERLYETLFHPRTSSPASRSPIGTGTSTPRAFGWATAGSS